MYKIVGIAIVAVLTATLIAGAIAAPQDAFAGGHHKRHHHHDDGGNCNGGSICQSNEQSIRQSGSSNTATQTASNQACIGDNGANACRSQ